MHMLSINGGIMNNTIKLFFVALAFLNVNPAYSFERIDLDPNRTSMAVSYTHLSRYRFKSKGGA